MKSLPDLTASVERRNVATAYLDVLRFQALGRSLDTLPPSPYHDRIVKAAALDHDALRNASSAFVDVAKVETVLGKLGQWTLPATPGAPVIVIGPVAADFVAPGDPIPAASLPIAGPPAEVTKIAFLIALFARAFDDSKAGRRAFERALVLSIAKAEDGQLLSDTAAVVGERPAGLRNGAPVFAVAEPGNPGSVADAMASAIGAVSGGAASQLVAIVTSGTTAGLAPFGHLDPTGSLGGVPIITASAGPAGLVTLLDASALAVVDGGLTIDASAHAAIDFTVPPGSPPSPLVPMFQTDSIGLRIARYVWWHAPPGSVSVLDLGLAGS